MRILHVAKAKGIGGSERHLLALLPAVVDAGHEVRMCVATTADGQRFVDELRVRGVDAVTVPAGADVNPLLVRRLVREIAAFAPDLVHTHLIHADLHGQLAARVAGVPGVSSVHGTVAALRRQPFKAAGALVGRLPPLTIAISHYVRRFLEQLGQRPLGTVRVVHYGLDVDDWPPHSDQRARTRDGLGLEPDHVAVGITARLIPGKGHDLLLDAAEHAVAQVPDLRLLVAGDGPVRAELERRAERLPPGTVRFLGFVEDVRPVVQASDVLAFPTSPALGEGFGLAALEAMAAERPVVATEVGALPEVVRHGETGIVVRPEEPLELADALVELASDEALRARLGRRGRERAETVFGLDTMVERTLEIYREAAAA